jgi:hypothetical protein
VSGNFLHLIVGQPSCHLLHRGILALTICETHESGVEISHVLTRKAGESRDAASLPAIPMALEAGEALMSRSTLPARRGDLEARPRSLFVGCIAGKEADRKLTLRVEIDGGVRDGNARGSTRTPCEGQERCQKEKFAEPGSEHALPLRTP